YLLAGKVITHQVNHYQKKDKRIQIARKFVEGAAINMLKNLRYYHNRDHDVEDIIHALEAFTEEIPGTTAVDELMGIEGNIRHAYYAAFDVILKDFTMGNRTRQPPQNEVNTLISFGN